MSDPYSPNPDQKPPRNLNIWTRLGMAFVGMVFVMIGISQMSKGYAEMKAADNPAASEITDTVKKSLEEVKKFKDDKGNLSFDYPANWTVAEDATNETPFRANALDNLIDFRISKEAVPEAMDANAYIVAMDKVVGQEKRIHDINKISEDKVTINGVEGIKRVQTLKHGDTPIIIKQVYIVIVNKNNAYCSVGTTTEKLFPDVEPVFAKVYNSYKFE
ncbi:MAG: hypothetical protein KIT34_10725 [Cyanobacteria bacterium TGS_CYA1]|nr:hypothetical protein [Cyanobacteria bacterium TGS_CYA1]